MARTQLLSINDVEMQAIMEDRHERLCHQFQDIQLDLKDLPMGRDFRILNGLGRGRQGIVFEARYDGYMDCTTRHAIKFFDPSLFTENRAYDVEMVRIARQVSVLQQLYHPNLVNCETFNEHCGIGVLVMELVEGMDIRALLNAEAHYDLESRLSAKEWEHFNNVVFTREYHTVQAGVAFYILRKMLRGLEVMHRIGYIHSDIKPSNVMINRFGTVKLIDFGRATLIKDPGEQFLASPMYMAPELHRRETITPQADIYSAGLVLMEMLHGGPLIDLYSTEEEIHRFKQTLPDRISEFLPAALQQNKELLKILRSLLAVDLADRYQTAEQADTGADGARVIHQQLAKADLDSDYGLELETYIAQRIPRSKVIRRRKLGSR